jgi:hypothetical protein
MKAVAIKKGHGQEKAAGFQEMGTLRCDGCGEHERDKKHTDRIELPD